MKRTLLLQCLSSVALIALAVWVGLGLITSVQLSKQSKVGPLDEASRNPVSANHAEWNQFYDAVRVGRADPATASRMSVDQVPGPSTAPASPVVPHPASSERGVKTDAPSTQAAALPDRPREQSVNTPGQPEQSWNQEPRESAPAVTAAESAPPEVAQSIATAPVPALDAHADKPTQQMTSPAAPPLPRAKVIAPVPATRSAARVRQATPEPDREPGAQPPLDTIPRARRAPKAAECATVQWTAMERHAVGRSAAFRPAAVSVRRTIVCPARQCAAARLPAIWPILPLRLAPANCETNPCATISIAAAV